MNRKGILLDEKIEEYQSHPSESLLHEICSLIINLDEERIFSAKEL